MFERGCGGCPSNNFAIKSVLILSILHIISTSGVFCLDKMKFNYNLLGKGRGGEWRGGEGYEALQQIVFSTQ